MEIKNLFSVGPTAQVTVSNEFQDSITALRQAVRNTIGQETKRNIWPYRDASGSYLALDIDGDRGSVSITMAIVGETDLSEVLNTCTISNPTIYLADGVDAFYLAQTILS